MLVNCMTTLRRSTHRGILENVNSLVHTMLPRYFQRSRPSRSVSVAEPPCRWLAGCVAVALLVLAVGCVSAKKTESLLLEAGFKIARADTPEKQAHLRSLPEGKVIRINRNEVVYYVYADVKNNVLYVGREPEYQQYKNDLWLAQRTRENQNQAEFL